jgi:hypothetical protein
MLENPVIFNSATIPPESPSFKTLKYWIRLTGFTGALGGGDVRSESHPIPGANEERIGDVLRSGQTIVLSGEIRALGFAALTASRRYLQQAFNQDNQLHALKFQNTGEPQIQFKAYVSQPFVCDDRQPDHLNWHDNVWQWVVGLRAPDPRTYLASDGTTLYPSWQVTP